MAFSFLPTMIAGAITDLTPELLRSHGVKLLMMDFDNTIVPYTTDIPTEAVTGWFQAMKDAEFPVCVVSNSRSGRVKIFCEKYGIPCITHARKPFPKGIRQCLKRFDLAPGDCALVGDQIYTDTLGANCAGMQSILVEAIDNHNFWLKFRHVLEKPFIFLARKRRIST